MARLADDQHNNLLDSQTINEAAISGPHLIPTIDQIPDTPPVLCITSRFTALINSFTRWGLPVLLGLLALGFNLYRLGDPSVWFDEAFSVELARQPLPLLWHIIFGPEPNMELYYLLLHYWLLLTHACGLNPTEVVVRLPSALLAALSTVVLFMFGRRFLSPTAATVGAGLYLLNDLQLTYAQQARGYSLQLLLLCLSWYALLRAFTSQRGMGGKDEGALGDQQERPRRYTSGTLFVSGRQVSMWWPAYMLFTTLAIYTQLFSAFVLLAQICTVGILCLLPDQWRALIRHHLVAYCLSLLGICILNIPMVLVSRAGAKTGWLPVPHLGDLFNLFAVISGYNRPYLIAIAISSITAIVLVTYGAARASVERAPDIVPLPYGAETVHRGGVMSSACPASQNYLVSWLPLLVALLCWLLVPTLVSYEISHSALRLFSARYLVVIVPPLCLLMGMAVAALRVRFVQLILALVLLALALSAVPMYYRSAQVEDWNSTTHWLIQHYRPGDGIVCYDNDVEQGCQIAVQYYLDAYPSAAHFDQDSPGAFSWQKFGPQNPTAGYDAAINPTALAAYGARHPRLFFVTGRIPTDADAARALAAQHWLDTHYHFIAQIVTRTVTVRLYATKATSIIP